MKTILITSFVFFSLFLGEKKKSYVEDDCFRDCTVNIKGNFDGVKVDVEVTISDVSWARCQLLKAKVALLNKTSD